MADKDDQDQIIEGDTCFAARSRFKSSCPKAGCRYWINDPDVQNCSLIAADTHRGMTLEQIGQVFGLTRMRVCQIEKNIYRKISQQLDRPEHLR